MTDKPVYLAMWSGPRNISTAMLRAWGNRPDTIVCDEPFYACYLVRTGLPHPLADEIIARYPTDWRVVVDSLTAPLPPGRQVYYQKHMTHHLLPEFDWSWLARCTNAFLIRHPRDVIHSYLLKNNDPTCEDIGFPQQLAIYEEVRRQTGTLPPILDAADVARDPERYLRLLCDAVGVEFSACMLAWEPGLRDTDGLWASHWYGEVLQSTGFRPPRPRTEPLPNRLRDVHERCLSCYEPLYDARLR